MSCCDKRTLLTIFITDISRWVFVYRMSRLCGGAHEMSGIPAPLWLCGWVVGGFMGWVGECVLMWGGGGVGGVVGWCVCEGWVGWWWGCG